MKSRTYSYLFLILICFGLAIFVYLTRPANNRDWDPTQAVLAYVTQEEENITIHNIRRFRYLTSDNDYEINYTDKTIKLTDIIGVDFIVEPFAQLEAFAHTMVSFRLADGDHITVSIETRREHGEKWDAWLGLLRQYELIYVVADEQDAIYVRTNMRREKTYLYQTIATPDQAQAMFVQMMSRVNALYRQPELYNTLTANCTTELVRDFNQIAKRPIRFSWRYVLPGYADTLAYDLGLLDSNKSFAELEQVSYINDKVNPIDPLTNLSEDIRK